MSPLSLALLPLALADTGLEDPGFLLYDIVPVEIQEGDVVPVVFLGDGFQQGAEARIGGLQVSGLDVLNPETLAGDTPTALPEGIHDVEVTQDGESVVLPEAFLVSAPDLGICGCGAVPGPPLTWAVTLGLGFLVARRRKG